MILYDIDGYASPADGLALLKRYLLNFSLWICSTLCCMPAASRLVSFTKDSKRVDAGNQRKSCKLRLYVSSYKTCLWKNKTSVSTSLCVYIHILSTLVFWQTGRTYWYTLTDHIAPANAIVDWRTGNAFFSDCSIPQEFFETRKHLSHLAEEQHEAQQCTTSSQVPVKS